MVAWGSEISEPPCERRVWMGVRRLGRRVHGDLCSVYLPAASLGVLSCLFLSPVPLGFQLSLPSRPDWCLRSAKGKRRNATISRRAIPG
jgi:hypothetical protein